MMVIFLTGLVSMILLRTLRRDYARYTQVHVAALLRQRPAGPQAPAECKETIAVGATTACSGAQLPGSPLAVVPAHHASACPLCLLCLAAYGS